MVISDQQNQNLDFFFLPTHAYLCHRISFPKPASCTSRHFFCIHTDDKLTDKSADCQEKIISANPPIYLKSLRGFLGLFGPSHDPGSATTDLVFPTSAFVTRGNANRVRDRVYLLFHRSCIHLFGKRVYLESS